MKDFNTHSDNGTTPTEADQELTLVINLHDAIESFVDFEGSEATSRKLQTAAGMIAHVEQEMPKLADKHVKSVLGDAGFKQWLDEGRTYASFARLFLGRGEGDVNGEAV
ncbi:hypothetical protein [Celeribacter sp.]|uniref:hypothetical protein n=1 Tax=Celeribacter sp. TaxID=1890673 RepID=UPI003A92EFF5